MNDEPICADCGKIIWGQVFDPEILWLCDECADAEDREIAATDREIARKIVEQALKHEDAIETKISVATLLIGIEAELKRKADGRGMGNG